MANFTFDSANKETKIVTGFDSNNNPITESKVITKDNAYEIYQQESRYWALYFCQYLFSNEKNFHKSCMNTSSHTDVQRDFLIKDSEDKGVAMLIEGTYWRNEAKDAGTFSKWPGAEDVETRLMPLPVQGTGSVKEGEGKSPVVIDTLSSYAFINANIASKHDSDEVEMAKEFLQFCYTDVSLSEFTVKSSVTKDVSYTLSDAEYNGLSDYAKSVWDIKKYGKVVNPISGEPEYIKNVSLFHMTDTNIWQTNNGCGRNPIDAFTSGGTSARKYFEGLKKTQEWWNGLAR